MFLEAPKLWKIPEVDKCCVGRMRWRWSSQLHNIDGVSIEWPGITPYAEWQRWSNVKVPFVKVEHCLIWKLFPGKAVVPLWVFCLSVLFFFVTRSPKRRQRTFV
jgi:hypothetical protein